MATRQIDRENLSVTGAHALIPQRHVVVDDIGDTILVILTQVFGPKGDDLIAASTVMFDGYPGIPLLVRAAGREELVHVSPFHGDPRKVGMEGLEPGTRCTLFCPVSKSPLERVGCVEGMAGIDYYALYLTPKMSHGERVVISDIWDDYHSRIIDHFELISAWDVDA